MIRITDPKGENIDSHQKLQIGKEVEIKASAIGDRATKQIFKGEIVAIEPEFSQTGVNLAIRALRQGPQAQPPAQGADVPADVGVRHGQQDRPRGGLGPGRQHQRSSSSSSRATRPTGTSSALARCHDYRFYIDDDKLALPSPAHGAGSRGDAEVAGHLITFRPRVSGVQQVETVNVRGWDPKAKARRHGTASGATTVSQPGIQRSKVSSDLGGGTTVIADRLVANTGEATAVAKSALSGRAEAFVEAEGVAFGDPAIQAGAKVKIEGVGTKLGGTYIVSSSTHSYRGETGLPDDASRSPDAPTAACSTCPPARAPRLEPRPRGRPGDQQQRPRADGARAREVPVARVRQRGERLGARRDARAPATRAG